MLYLNKIVKPEATILEKGCFRIVCCFCEPKR